MVSFRTRLCSGFKLLPGIVFSFILHPHFALQMQKCITLHQKGEIELETLSSEQVINILDVDFIQRKVNKLSEAYREIVLRKKNEKKE